MSLFDKLTAVFQCLPVLFSDQNSNSSKCRVNGKNLVRKYLNRMCSVNSDLLLHPELLSTEALVRILVERKIKMDNLETMTRERLIQIFNQFCLPHSQRKFKDTGRGKILNKQQEERTKQSSGKIRDYTSLTSVPVRRDTKERIKPAIENCDYTNLSIKLVPSNVIDNSVTNDYDMAQSNKRKISSISPSCQPEVKKQRVKIMWP